MSQPDSVRTAHARVAARERWHPTDVVALAEARRDLDVANATRLTASAAEVLRAFSDEDRAVLSPRERL